MDNIYKFTSLMEALEYFKNDDKKIFVIGGEQLYKEAINNERYI